MPRPRARFDTLAGALRGLLFALLTAIVSSTAFAQVAVPAVSRQPLRIILPANAGSGMDLTARTIREALSVALGDRPVIVENRPGAAGLVAIQVLRAAQPDGATIGLLSNSYLLNRSGPQSTPNDRANDEITPISIVAGSPLVFVVNTSSLPARNARELEAMLRLRRTATPMVLRVREAPRSSQQSSFSGRLASRHGISRMVARRRC